MAILVVIVELRPIMMSRFEGDPISIAPAFVFAALYLWGWVPAVTLMAVSVLLSEVLARKEPWKLFFNVGNYTLSVVAASAVLSRGTWPETIADDVACRRPGTGRPVLGGVPPRQPGAGRGPCRGPDLVGVLH